MALFFIGARWSDPDDPGIAQATAVAHAALRAERPVAVWQPVGLAALALLVLGLPTLGRTQLDTEGSRTAIRLQLPGTLGQWRAQQQLTQGWEPEFRNATATLATEYVGPGGEVSVHVAYFRHQHTGAKLVTSTNRFTDGLRWQAAHTCMVPTTLSSLIAAECSTLSMIDGAACTTVSTP